MRLFFTSVCVSVALLAISCTEEVSGKISIVESDYEISFEGGSGYIMLNSTHPWIATCEEEWVTITSTEGDSGSGKLTFSVEQNSEPTTRKATVYLRNNAQNHDTEFYIIQGAFIPSITVTPQEIKFSTTGGDKAIMVMANFEYEVENDCEWLNCTISDEGVTLSAEPSFETETRTAEIFVVNMKYDVSEPVSVSQEEFKPTLEISNHDLTIGANAGTHTVKVDSNIPYDIHCDADWLECIATDGAIQITVQASTLDTEREAIIVLSNDTYNISDELALTQEAGVAAPIELSNSDFEQGLQGWSINRYGNGSQTKVEVVNGEGEGGSKALRISQAAADGKCCVAVERTLTGLKPDEMYRMTARMRYSNIAEGCGAVIFSPNDRQYWNASEWTKGSKNSWTTATVDFMTDDNGQAKISCALGFWLSTIAGGGYATGTVYYDNISISKVTSREHYMRESEHMRIYFLADRTSVTDEAADTWLKKVDAMYEAYEDLVGAVPHDGRKLAILTSYGVYSGYWALAGYPILWNANHGDMDETINEATTRNTISFGLMHELGHVFNVNYTPKGGKRYYSNWDWNDEMFANFRMQYGLEMTGNAVYQKGNGDKTQQIYRGREILNMYKQDYDQTLPKGKLNDNAIHYLLARLAGEEFIGWEPFKRTFREITTKSCPYSNKYDMFTYFVNTLSKHASEVHGKEYDLLNDKECFSDADIAAIKAQLK